MRLIFLLIAAAAAFAQPPARPTFEVASVKAAPGCQMNAPGNPSGGRLDVPCVSLRALIRVAYGGFRGDRLNTRFLEVVGGPAWLDSEKYQIHAKAEEKAPTATLMGPMLQTLLEERFQLKVHTEPKETPVFVLTVAKPGKLTPAKEGSCIPIDLNNIQRPMPGVTPPKYCGLGSMTGKPGGLVADIPGTTMEEFCGRMLPGFAGRPVVDKTGLADRFDLHFEFAPEMRGGTVTLNGVPQPAPPPSDSLPSIFTALHEQLGLKLAADKAPIDVIVVDSAQKPTEN